MCSLWVVVSTDSARLTAEGVFGGELCSVPLSMLLLGCRQGALDWDGSGLGLMSVLVWEGSGLVEGVLPSSSFKMGDPFSRWLALSLAVVSETASGNGSFAESTPLAGFFSSAEA